MKLSAELRNKVATTIVDAFLKEFPPHTLCKLPDVVIRDNIIELIDGVESHVDSAIFTAKSKAVKDNVKPLAHKWWTVT